MEELVLLDVDARQEQQDSDLLSTNLQDEPEATTADLTRVRLEVAECTQENAALQIHNDSAHDWQRRSRVGRARCRRRRGPSARVCGTGGGHARVRLEEDAKQEAEDDDCC